MVHGGLQHLSPQRRAVAAKALFLCRSIMRARQTSQATLFDGFKALVLQQSDMLLAVLASGMEGGGERRIVHRALAKWRGSTLSGYLRAGDDQTYLENFRCTKQRLDAIVYELRGSHLDAPPEKLPGSSDWRKVRRTVQARAMTDPPSRLYKVAVALYATGQGGPVKVLADAASIGVSTLRKYLEQYADACTHRLKPTYMSGTPWSVEERRAVQQQFASRRGLGPIALACDGSHIPYKPKGKRLAMEYRNFKGWSSILAVAFIDSFYRFYDIDVGYPGRAGDNTVLTHNWFMREVARDPDRWLGPGGVILGDSGASDGDAYFMNPYHSPTDPKRLWFNFCHSSTRFFVEQAFGMWKSRFRFLLHSMPGTTHKLFTKLIYASAIMHNVLVVHSKEVVSGTNMDAQAWSKFFTSFKSHRCPTCVRERRAHCVHQALFRNGAAQQKSYRVAPSKLRDELCDRAWEVVCAQGDEHRLGVEKSMDDVCDARRVQMTL
jgi:hypothetical protein